MNHVCPICLLVAQNFRRPCAWDSDRSPYERSLNHPSQTSVKRELKAVATLRLDRDIRRVKATALWCQINRNTRINESGVYEQFPNDSTAKVERKVQKPFSKHKCARPIDLIPQETCTSIRSSQASQTRHSSETYSEFHWFPLLCRIWILFQDSGYFIQLLKSENPLRHTLVISDVVSLLTHASGRRGMR
jgi:hypothetical protein